MKKIYLNTLTPEEIIARLKKGEVIKLENLDDIYKMIDGMIVRIRTGEDFVFSIGETICINKIDDFYFEEEEEFEITGVGMYRTQDGRKAFVSFFYEDGTARGVIENETETVGWWADGRNPNGNVDDDLVGKWEE